MVSHQWFLCAAQLTFACWLVAGASVTGEPTAQRAEKEWGPSVGGMAVSIAADKAAYDPGERIRLSVRCKNVGQKAITVMEYGPPMDHRLLVSSSNGQPVPMTLLGKRAVRDYEPAARNFFELKPGEESVAEFELDRIFDLSVHGAYTVTVDRYLWNEDRVANRLTKTVVGANRIDFKIRDPGPPFMRKWKHAGNEQRKAAQ